MVDSLTWKIFGPEATHQCLTAGGIDSVREVLILEEKRSQGVLFASERRSAAQVAVLIDLYAHLLLFAKGRQMSPEKVSTLVGVMHEVHERSMKERRSRVASYDLLRSLIVQHSVCRPPYSAAIFDTADVEDIDEYLLGTYYRHYKMYVFAFVPKQFATVRAVSVGIVGEVPPRNLPSLSTAIPEAIWKEKMEERERTKEEKAMEAEELASTEYAEHRQRLSALNDPRYTDGIREQLNTIRAAVTRSSMGHLDVIEHKLAALETKVEEMAARSQPAMKQGKSK